MNNYWILFEPDMITEHRTKYEAIGKFGQYSGISKPKVKRVHLGVFNIAEGVDLVRSDKLQTYYAAKQ